MLDDDLHTTIYQCEICSQAFTKKKEFLGHHMSPLGDSFVCCKCDENFQTTAELYTHYDSHKADEEEEIELDYRENVEAVMNIPADDELLYIIDSTQCVNEVIIDGEAENQETETAKPDINIVQVEHGYMLPSVFKGQLGSKRRYKKKEPMSEDETAAQALTKEIPTSSSLMKPKPRPRHDAPDFSSTNYVVVNPTEEIDIVHYKCLRCEQLFINKVGFYRHIEKGKCYINSCDVCNALFNRNSEFYEHYLQEHVDRAICNFCFRTFMYEKNVKEHMLRHLDQFRHRCEKCNKGFYTVREYRNHYKNRHMGIRHNCDTCGRSFADEYYFKRHVATHQKRVALSVTL